MLHTALRHYMRHRRRRFEARSRVQVSRRFEQVVGAATLLRPPAGTAASDRDWLLN